MSLLNTNVGFIGLNMKIDLKNPENNGVIGAKDGVSFTPGTPSTPTIKLVSQFDNMVNNQIEQISNLETNLGGTDGGSKKIIDGFKNLGINATGIF